MSPQTARLVKRWMWIGVGVWIIASVLGVEAQRTIHYYFQNSPPLSRAELMLPALIRGLLFAGAATGVGMLCHLAVRRLPGATRPAPPGHCESCLYDLKGSGSDVCPECGSPARRTSRPRAGR